MSRIIYLEKSYEVLLNRNCDFNVWAIWIINPCWWVHEIESHNFIFAPMFVVGWRINFPLFEYTWKSLWDYPFILQLTWEDLFNRVHNLIISKIKLYHPFLLIKNFISLKESYSSLVIKYQSFSDGLFRQIRLVFQMPFVKFAPRLNLPKFLIEKSSLVGHLHYFFCVAHLRNINYET